ncbi:MAG: hypothetical protein ACJ72Z_02270, partial [Pyrinomonadaceae bacterium]
WTPSRAYSHYHGGVRILSETASAKLATPITVKWEDVRGGEGYDARVESANFGPVWHGGEWHIGDITRYMTTAAFSLLNNAADNRERWLSRSYQIGKEAVRPRPKGDVAGFVFDGTSRGGEQLLGVLRRAGVESEEIQGGRRFVRIDQPYGMFAKALIERQKYPHLANEKGEPIAPYDVTAHTLSLLYGQEVETVYVPYIPKRPDGAWANDDAPCRPPRPNQNGLYKPQIPSMDEGWTRFIFERQRCFTFESVDTRQIRQAIPRNINYLVFADQSSNQLLNGYAPGTMPDEYVGGVGKEGVENLKKFVEAGGTLVFLNRSSEFAIREFNLPVKDVTRGLARKDFYIPGSILRTELDTTHPIAKGMPQQSIAWFENSPAFEIQTDPLALSRNFRIIASYPKDPKQILLSGWALGAEKIAGKAALVEFTIGKGKIVLFGFRPQYRGQSLATFPLLFNAISQ